MPGSCGRTVRRPGRSCWMTRLTRTSESRRLIARHADRESPGRSLACDIWQRQGRAHGGRQKRRTSDPDRVHPETRPARVRANGLRLPGCAGRSRLRDHSHNPYRFVGHRPRARRCPRRTDRAQAMGVRRRAPDDPTARLPLPRQCRRSRAVTCGPFDRRSGSRLLVMTRPSGRAAAGRDHRQPQRPACLNPACS